MDPNGGGGGDTESNEPPVGEDRQRLDSSWFHRAVEAAGHAIFFTDFAGHIVYVNPAFEEITGYPAEEVLGETPRRLNSGYHSPEYFRQLWETITSGEVWREEIVNRRRDDDIYIANQTIAPVTDPADGTITHFVAIQTDVTKQREHQQALERSQDLSNRTEAQANIGGWELNSDTGELRWTAGTRRIHQVPHEYEPTLDQALEYYHPEDRDRVRTALENAAEWDLPYDVEARLISAEGTTRLVRTTGERVESEDGDVLVRGTIKDITEEQTLRQQLMVFNRILRHNLRNELNVVMGHASRLEASLDALRSDQAADSTTDSDAKEDHSPAVLSRTEAQNALEQITAAADSLLGTAGRAREFDRVYRQLHDIRPVEVRPIAEAVAAQYCETSPSATIEIDGLDPALLSNAEAVRLILEELVANAVEHAAEGDTVVTIDICEDRDGSLRICVADEGSGIPNLERQVVMEGKETQLKHGRGIGLWVVKWLLAPLGGSLEITDNEPTGTVVELVFPPSRWKSNSGE